MRDLKNALRIALSLMNFSPRFSGKGKVLLKPHCGRQLTTTQKGRDGGKTRLTGDGSLPFSSIWRDVLFDAVKFTEMCFPFPEDLSSDYQKIRNNSYEKLSNVVKTHLLRVLLIGQVQLRNT